MVPAVPGLNLIWFSVTVDITHLEVLGTLVLASQTDAHLCQARYTPVQCQTMGVNLSSHPSQLYMNGDDLYLLKDIQNKLANVDKLLSILQKLTLVNLDDQTKITTSCNASDQFTIKYQFINSVMICAHRIHDSKVFTFLILCLLL